MLDLFSHYHLLWSVADAHHSTRDQNTYQCHSQITGKKEFLKISITVKFCSRVIFLENEPHKETSTRNQREITKNYILEFPPQTINSTTLFWEKGKHAWFSSYYISCKYDSKCAARYNN